MGRDWWEIETTLPPLKDEGELAARARATGAAAGIEARWWGHGGSDHRRRLEGGTYYVQGPELRESQHGSAKAGGVP